MARAEEGVQRQHEIGVPGGRATEAELSTTASAGDTTGPPRPEQSRPATPVGKVKVSFNLWPEEVDRLRRLATNARTTVTAALQRAIADETFFADEIDKGARVLLRYPDGEYREVIMRR